MNKWLSYQDVYLLPNYSELGSRSEANTNIEFLGHKFKLPVVPANMVDVVNEKICTTLGYDGYFYIFHRFGPPGTTFNFVKSCASEDRNSPKDYSIPIVSISTGVNEDSLKELKDIKKEKFPVDFITIDVAHGHHIKVKDRIQWIKDNFSDTKVIAGNIATSDAYLDLIKWGADAAKIGIGGGRICTTRNKTGFHVPMFSCVQNISSEFVITKNHTVIDNTKNKIPIIADGGIQEFGDISKALVAGADMVMCGGLFAECIDSPARFENGQKLYRGSTSYEIKGKNSHIEGKMIPLSHSVTYRERLEEIKQALQSSISYAGGTDLTAFWHVDYLTLK